MLKLDDYRRIFNYYTQQYRLNGIYININDSDMKIFNNVEVKDSNQTLVVQDMESFTDVYFDILSSDAKIVYISFDFSFFRLKYFVNLNRLVVTTDTFNDVNIVQNFISNADIKHVSYNIRN